MAFRGARKMPHTYVQSVITVAWLANTGAP